MTNLRLGMAFLIIRVKGKKRQTKLTINVEKYIWQICYKEMLAIYDRQV